MIKVVSDGKLITKYQKQFIRLLKTVCNERIACIVGFQGRSEEMFVFYSSKYNFWFSVHQSGTRFWNAFGIGKPVKGRNTSISVEINFPYEGIDRRIAGVFGHGQKGEVLLLHRGKIGGGRTGIGKQLFLENFRGEFVFANDGDVETELSIIGSMNSKHLPQQISNFVSEVHRIKELPNKDSPDFPGVKDFKFTEESFGTNTGKHRSNSAIERTHGIVVNALAHILENKGFKIGNNRNMDLFIYKRRRITTIFEIKTSSSTQDLYRAVGQLLIYSMPIEGRVKLFMVLPDKLSKPVTNRLRKLGIEVIYYTWENNEPIFLLLNKVFPQQK